MNCVDNRTTGQRAATGGTGVDCPLSGTLIWCGVVDEEDDTCDRVGVKCGIDVLGLKVDSELGPGWWWTLLLVSILSRLRCNDAGQQPTLSSRPRYFHLTLLHPKDHSIELILATIPNKKSFHTCRKQEVPAPGLLSHAQYSVHDQCFAQQQTTVYYLLNANWGDSYKAHNPCQFIRVHNSKSPFPSSRLDARAIGCVCVRCDAIVLAGWISNAPPTSNGQDGLRMNTKSHRVSYALVCCHR